MADPIRVTATTPFANSDGTLSRDGMNAYQSLVDAVSVLVGTRTIADLPPAGTGGRMAFVSNAPGGGTMAYDDGTNWRKMHDNSVIV